ncbi:uncharacterized protein TNCT_425031 [Trichonephila clavata]|uniref:Uncharacterized protein n=1 Tax=Trichonephila clavata TaxID=2740835 RepID=A0A8X6JA63_TRICU|nr:uncharacterized protein TNCT_425031 [Trichonephila clavata]
MLERPTSCHLNRFLKIDSRKPFNLLLQECSCAGRTPTCSARIGRRTDCWSVPQYASSSPEAYSVEDSVGRKSENRERKFKEEVKTPLQMCQAPSDSSFVCRPLHLFVTSLLFSQKKIQSTSH